MDLDLVFVGTAGSVPTAGRGLSSALVRRGGDRLLFDCGEGTQRQLMRSTGLAELDAVFITHLHADHVLGLPGMLKTFALRERERPLVVAGPPGIERFWRNLLPVIGRLTYEVELRQLDAGRAWEGDGYAVDAVPTAHGVRSAGWLLHEQDRPGRFDVQEAQRLGVRAGAEYGVLQRGGEVTTEDGRLVRAADVLGEARSGRRIVYSGDTAACAQLRDAARDATLLVHEATFLQIDSDRARATHHTTALDAALTAAAADVQMLALTHISTRYAPRDVLAEARAVFPTTVVARDFDVVEIPFPERGSPRLIASGARDRGRHGAPEGAAEASVGTT